MVFFNITPHRQPCQLVQMSEFPPSQKSFMLVRYQISAPKHDLLLSKPDTTHPYRVHGTNKSFFMKVCTESMEPRVQTFSCKESAELRRQQIGNAILCRIGMIPFSVRLLHVEMISNGIRSPTSAWSFNPVYVEQARLRHYVFVIFLT